MAVVNPGEEADSTGIGCTGQPDEEVKRVDACWGAVRSALMIGTWAGASPGALAAPDLAAHDGGADSLLALLIGGVDVGIVEEGEEGVALGGEVRDQPALGVEGTGFLGRQLDRLSQL